MRLYFYIFLNCWFCTKTVAQEPQKFGKVDLQDFNESSCFYEMNAVAENLIDEGTVRFVWDDESDFFITSSTYRKRIKIYSQKGLEYANVKLRYIAENKFEKISNIKASTFNLVNQKVDEVILDKSTILKQDINKIYSQLSFALPNVRIGSIIEYTYTIERKSYSVLNDWYFQSSIPTRFSYYTLTLPEYFSFITRLFKNLEIDNKTVERKKTISIHNDDKEIKTFTGEAKQDMIARNQLTFTELDNVFIAEKIPSFKEESFMAYSRNYVNRIEFQFSEMNFNGTQKKFNSSWKEITNNLLESEYFGNQLKKKINLPELELLITQRTDSQKKEDLIIHYFLKNFKWDEQYEFLCDDISKTISQKKGNSAQLHFLLLNQLRKYGIESYPLLASTKNNGALNKEYPFLYQFNTLLAYVKRDTGFQIIDITKPYKPIYLISEYVANTVVFLVDELNPRFIELQNELPEKNTIILHASIDALGKTNGTITVKSSHYAIEKRQQYYMADKKQYSHHFFQNKNKTRVLQDSTLECELKDNTILHQKLDYREVLQANGNYFVLETNELCNLNIPVFTEKIRISDIDFLTPKDWTLYANYTIDEKFSIQELPKDYKISIENNEGLFERKIQFEQGVLNIFITFKLNQIYYSVDEFENIKKFLNSVQNKLDEPIIFTVK